jgi:hypothetical protein
MKPNQFSLLVVTLTVASLFGQDETDLNFVRDWIGFRVVGEFGANPNNFEIFNDYCIDFQEDPGAQGGTCNSISPYGVEFDTFVANLEAAYAEGRGGVIDFETPILGPSYRNADRLGHRAFMEQYILDNPLETFEAAVREEFPDLGDADVLALSTKLQQEAAYAAAEEELLDPSDIIPVVARIDRSIDSTVENPQLETNLSADIIGFYGPGKETPLVIKRGPNSYTEGQLATVNFPAPWDLNGLINAEFFNSVGISTYSGGNAYRPVSGINTFNGGIHDMLFDPRDNITSIGFAFLTYDNFQYYQGDSGTPVNPNNMRVYVEFSNGESEELAQTSRQSSGNWDVFFGIEAPEGESITRLQLRVVGRNWRTFVAVDDFAFITEPAVPYIVGDTAFTSSEGAAFYEILRFGQNPETVSFDGLPPGLSYDPDTGLLGGTLGAAGSYTTTVSLTNSIGTNTETIDFEVGPPLSGEAILQIDPIDDVNVVLRRDLPVVTVTSSLDDTLPFGSIDYFALVEKLAEDGSRTLSSLDFLGLTLRDNTILGTPGSAQQIGSYEVTVFARTSTSADSKSFLLTVLAPTLAPNFDSNGTTDFAVVSGGNFLAANNPDSEGDLGTVPLSSRLSGIPASADVFSGDFNGDNQTDLLVWDSGSGTVRQYISGEPGMDMIETVLLEGIDAASGEQIIDVADFDGDGTSDIFWRNEAMKRDTIWLMRNGRIAWAGPMEQAEGINVLLMTADFAGDGSLMHLAGRGSGVARYSLDQYKTFTSLGEIQSTEVEFVMNEPLVPTHTADFSNDGRADILWQNNLTGEAFIWEMQGTATDTSYLSEAEDGSLNALPGIPLLPAGFDWSPVAAADLNNDQFADLVLRNRNSASLGLLFLRNGQSLGSIIFIGGSTMELLAVGDYDGNSVNDLLVRNSASNALSILAIDASGGISTTAYGTNPPGARWLGGGRIENTATTINPVYDWLGQTAFLNTTWMYASDWGYLSPVAVDSSTGGGWFYDLTLGYVWTSPQYFPAVFQERNAFWLRYVVGSQEPRWFYNYIFGFYMTENEL